MFGSIGPWELVLILAVALIVVGPGKLPEVARSLGKATNEFKKATSGVKKEFQEAIKVEDPKQLITSAIFENSGSASNSEFVSQIANSDANNADKEAMPTADESRGGDTADLDKPEASGPKAAADTENIG